MVKRHPVKGVALFVGLGVLLLGCGGPNDAAEASPAPDDQEAPVNQLTDAEEAAGWTLLFDGTLDGWRGYQRDDVPAGWASEGDLLTFTPGPSRSGDIITAEQFGNFELRLDWRVADAGNSGIFFRVIEEGRYTYHSGPEMQVLDNAGHRDGRNPLTSAGSNYGLHAPTRDVTRPVGEWNEARIVVDGASVEHWLNGERIVAYELWTDEWTAMVAATKFAEWPQYGLARRGHIGLQDHGDPVWFRNIKILER